MGYRGPERGRILTVTLDAMVAVYDRRAGVTHLVAGPVTQILDALDGGEGTLAQLADRLDAADLRDVLTERIDELVATGLVERV